MVRCRMPLRGEWVQSVESRPHVPHASANTRSVGIICFKPSGWGLATASRSKNCAPGSLREANSPQALRGEFGMNQVASSSLTEELLDWIRACAWEGESTSDPAEEDMALTAKERRGRKDLSRNMIVTAVNNLSRCHQTKALGSSLFHTMAKPSVCTTSYPPSSIINVGYLPATLLSWSSHHSRLSE